MKNNLYISIAGLIGAGKTTLAKLLSEELGLVKFEERVNENVFLPRYYEDPKTWALHSQLFYLREKISQLLKIKDLLNTTGVLQDTPIYQDAFTYAKAQRYLGYMSDEDYKLYQDFYHLIVGKAPVPNLIIQLDASIDTLENRIKSRGRPFEQNIGREYLELLHKLQNDWLKNHSHIKTIRLNIDNQNLDLLNNRNYQQELIKKIKFAIN